MLLLRKSSNDRLIMSIRPELYRGTTVEYHRRRYYVTRMQVTCLNSFHFEIRILCKKNSGIWQLSLDLFMRYCSKVTWASVNFRKSIFSGVLTFQIFKRNLNLILLFDSFVSINSFKSKYTRISLFLASSTCFWAVLPPRIQTSAGRRRPCRPRTFSGSTKTRTVPFYGGLPELTSRVKFGHEFGRESRWWNNSFVYFPFIAQMSFK